MKRIGFSVTKGGRDMKNLYSGFFYSIQLIPMIASMNYKNKRYRSTYWLLTFMLK